MPTVDNVREIEVGDSWQGPPAAEGEALRLFSLESTIVTPQVEDYPFLNQRIFSGRFSYEDQTPFGVDSGAGTFQIRTESGLFILRKEEGSANTDQIVDAFSEAVNEHVKIHETNILSRSGLWRFIKSADGPVEVTVKHPTGDEMDLEQLQEEEDAELTISEIADREYPIISADIIFRTDDDESVHVRYSRSSISISAPSEVAHEYFVQRFERDVMSKSNLSLE